MSLLRIHADSARFILDRAHSREPGWKWPRYQEALKDPRSAASWWRPQSQEHTGKRRSILNRLPEPLHKRMSALLTSAFIEWKYTSVLSEGFHGIIGLSLFNPEERFAKIAEGGLLVVIAGRVTQAPKSSENFVWMKLFPTETVSGFDSPVLTAAHEGTRISLTDHAQDQTASFQLVDPDSLTIDAVFQGPAEPLAPLVGTELNPIPGGHWIVHNRMPFAATSGTISFGSAPTHLSTTRDTAAPGILKGMSASWTTAPGYFEHSYGLHPLPSQGWDFLFSPLPKMQGGIVLQTYRGCPDLKQLDVAWQDPQHSGLHSTSFKGTELSIEWTRKEYDRELCAWIPIERVLRGKNATAEIQVTHTIERTLHFLRPQTPTVRCFFIGEQLGTADWVLKDSQGTVLSTRHKNAAGGEIAFARFPSLGRLTQPFPVP